MVAREGQNWDGDEVHMVKANHTKSHRRRECEPALESQLCHRRLCS